MTNKHKAIFITQVFFYALAKLATTERIELVSICFKFDTLRMSYP